MRISHTILDGKPEGDHVEDLGTDGSIILKYILGKRGSGVWTRFICLMIFTDG